MTTNFLKAMIWFVTIGLFGLIGTYGYIQSEPEFELIPVSAGLIDPNFIRTNVENNSDSSVVLAAGDIADCGNDPKLHRVVGRIHTYLGLPGQKYQRGSGAYVTADLIEKYPEAIVLALGDLTYPNGNLGSFLRCYEPTWGRFKDRTYPTPGNHEYKIANQTGYFEYWGDRAGPERRGYYSFKLNNWLVLSLNSETEVHAGLKQSEWLLNELKKNKSKCILAFFHRPAVSSVMRLDSERVLHLQKVLNESGTSIVLNGHNHFFETISSPLRKIHNDTPMRTFVVGTGGTVRIDKKESSHFATANERIRAWGALKLTLEADGYTWEFLDATNRNNPTVSGQQTCRPRNNEI
jgi:hypothetical protein